MKINNKNSKIFIDFSLKYKLIFENYDIINKISIKFWGRINDN